MHWFLRTSDRRPPAPRHFRPVLEILEDRLAPAFIGGTVGADFTNPTALQQAAFGAPTQFVGASAGLTFTGGSRLVSTPLNTERIGGVDGQVEPLPETGAIQLMNTEYGPILPTTMAGVEVVPTLMVYSAFSPIQLVTPPPPPVRAVTAFAPSGGGSGADAAGEAPGGPGAPGAPNEGNPVVPGMRVPGTPRNPQPPAGQGREGPGGRKPDRPNIPQPNPGGPDSLNSPSQDSSQKGQDTSADARRDEAWAGFLADWSSAQRDPFGDFPTDALLDQRIAEEVLAEAGC
jgi:hypothetical protein